MTASKSARARNARAAARNGTANRGGSAARNGPAGTGTAGTGTTVRNGAGARNVNGTANGGAADRARADSTRGDRARADRARGSTPGRAGRGAVPGKAVEYETAATGPSVWLQITTFLLAVAGLGVSTYLTIAHFTESTLAGCAETAGLVNCTKVTTSAQSYVFGIPVAVLGMAFFVFAVAIMSPWAWQAKRRGIHLLRIASLVAGIGFVVYLLYAELFIIGNICLYCTSVHVLTFVLFVLTMFAAAAWGLKPGARFLRRSPQTAE
jgi:uncharacterized membrane protein